MAVNIRIGLAFYLKCAMVLLVFFPWLCWHSAHSIEREQIRISAGLDLFQSVLAADMDIKEKRGADGSLLLILIYQNDKKTAGNIAKKLMAVERIRGIPIRVELIVNSALNQYSNTPPAGIFIIQDIRDNLPAVIDFGINHHVVVFSPFEGDVEAGVLGGIHISDRLLPYINLGALKASGIRIKPFFLRISKHYGD
jgi:hypothetical protein